MPALDKNTLDEWRSQILNRQDVVQVFQAGQRITPDLTVMFNLIHCDWTYGPGFASTPMRYIFILN